MNFCSCDGVLTDSKEISRYGKFQQISVFVLWSRWFFTCPIWRWALFLWSRAWIIFFLCCLAKKLIISISKVQKSSYVGRWVIFLFTWMYSQIFFLFSFKPLSTHHFRSSWNARVRMLGCTLSSGHASEETWDGTSLTLPLSPLSV